MAWTAKLTHTCSIVEYNSTTDLGHAVTDWTSVKLTTAGVACLIQPQTLREEATGAVIASHLLFVDYGDVPASLLAHGAERSHRVTTWVHSGLTDAGPFDVVEVIDAGGQGHHLEIRLLRVG